MCLWAIYIFPGSVHFISSSRKGKPIMEIYNLLTDTWVWKLGLRPRYSFSGNICFKFSAFCLCSVNKWIGDLCRYMNLGFFFLTLFYGVTNPQLRVSRCVCYPSLLCQLRLYSAPVYWPLKLSGPQQNNSITQRQLIKTSYHLYLLLKQQPIQMWPWTIHEQLNNIPHSIK